MNSSLYFRLFIFSLGLISAPQVFSRVSVLSCEPEWAALAQEIGGNLVKSMSATSAFQDPHHIEARPSLIARARVADLIFCSGSELEIGWLPLLLRQSGNPNIQQGKPGYLMASELVSRLEVPETLDRNMGDIHASGNPHVHLDPYRILKISHELTQRLSIIDPDNSAIYKSSLGEFSNRWKTAISRWETLAKPLRGTRVIVHHRSLSYLFDWLGIDTVADIEPKPGLPTSSAHLAMLLSDMQHDKPNFIVISAYQNERGARWLQKRTKLPLVTLPFTIGGNDESQTLSSLYTSTIDLLLEAVKDSE